MKKYKKIFAALACLALWQTMLYGFTISVSDNDISLRIHWLRLMITVTPRSRKK